jgi:leader peptidase (prepilin peptidase) / N-methyltransferase
MGLSEEFWAPIFFIYGALLGSFANVIIYRLPLGESVVKPRSHCRNCRNMVAWFDNIPIVSFLMLRGRCRHCQAQFSWRYPLVEFLMGLIFCALYLHLGFSFFLLEAIIFSFGLVTVSFIDLDHMILPDVFTLSGIVIGLVGAAINPDRTIVEALIGVLAGGGFLWAISTIYFLLRKQEGMGGGDIKLLAWIGAVLGWQSVPFVILSSSLFGTLVGLVVMSRTKGGMQTAIPFGPYLALGALFFIFGGSQLAHAYISLFFPLN